jgi:hypothetical protein
VRRAFPAAEGDSFALTRIKEEVKALDPETRVFLMRWLVKYYADTGMMFSPTITQRASA